MESKLYKKLDQNKVRCETCAHKCVLNPGDFGLCGVRENKEGTLKVLNYKRTISLSVDPIEKSPCTIFSRERKAFLSLQSAVIPAAITVKMLPFLNSQLNKIRAKFPEKNKPKRNRKKSKRSRVQKHCLYLHRTDNIF